MLLCYSENEMLTLAKKLLMLEPESTECVIEREDGVNFDFNLRMAIRQWYAALLLSADSELLPVEDLASACTLAAQGDGSVRLTLPWNAVRPVEVRLNSWKRSVSEFLAPDSPKALMQQSEWTRGGSEYPAAVLADSHIILYSSPSASPTLATARCVVWDNEHFIFHASLLASLKAALNFNS